MTNLIEKLNTMGMTAEGVILADKINEIIEDYNQTKLRLQYIEHAAFTAKQRTDYMLSGKEKCDG